MMKGHARRLDPFKDNLYRRASDAASGGTHVEKSCPKCSQKAGELVYYAESDFVTLSKATGRPEPQRLCNRHRKSPSTRPAVAPERPPEASDVP